MRESIRTAILIALLLIAVGFIYWVGHQGEETLRSSEETAGILNSLRL